LDYQCFLLENISKLTAARVPEGPAAPDYKNVIKVDSNQKPALVMNIIGHVGDSAANEFLNLCPEVYGLLTPYIKISRVEYDQLGQVIPGKEKNLKIPNFLEPSDIENITSGRVGRAAGAGIKSFSWGLEGVQPAEVDNNISANLVMYFQSVNDFFRQAAQAGEEEPNFLDLVIASPTVSDEEPPAPSENPANRCQLDDHLHRQYDGVNFRIKVCAGWASPPNLGKIFPTMKEDQIGRLETAIRRTRVSLYLQQVRHLITFNENGSLELSIDYQASLSGLLTGKTADIFTASAKSIEEIAKLEEEIAKIESSADLDEDDRNKIQRRLEEIQDLREGERLRKYKKLLDGLFKGGRIYNFAINPRELLLRPYAELSPVERARRAKRRVGTTVEIKTNIGRKFALLSEINKAITSGGGTGEVAAAASETMTAEFDLLNRSSTEVAYISYFYLGDLLDNILEQIRMNNAKEDTEGDLNFKFFMSDVEMIDPLVALQIKNLEEAIACGSLRKDVFFAALQELDPVTFNTGITQLMNIGDIPISVDAFQIWFKDNVVKKDKDKYFFLHFVKDICAYLITSALRSKCFGETLNFEQRFDAQPLALDARKLKEEIQDPLPVADLAASVRGLSSSSDAQNSMLGLILISTDSRPKKLEGKLVNDHPLGIYHHYIGSACGLVKKINFNREDQAYLRESKIQKKGALGPEQLRELYSAQLDLVGNNLYKNGNYIYISPLLLGATEEQLRLLGLHGYYLVTSVKSVITPNSFDTSITALHEGIKFSNEEPLQPLAYPVLQAERTPAWANPTDYRPPPPVPEPAVGTPSHERAERRREVAERTERGASERKE
jgi:hypothetical protein